MLGAKIEPKKAHKKVLHVKKEAASGLAGTGGSFAINAPNTRNLSRASSIGSLKSMGNKLASHNIKLSKKNSIDKIPKLQIKDTKVSRNNPASKTPIKKEPKTSFNQHCVTEQNPRPTE